MELSKQTREALAAKILDDSVKLQGRLIGLPDATWVEKTMSIGDMCRDAERGYYELRIAPNTIKVEACELPKHIHLGENGCRLYQSGEIHYVGIFRSMYFKTKEDAQQVSDFLNKIFRGE